MAKLSAQDVYAACTGDGDISKEMIWHERFLRDAEEKASWSKDPSTRCGAVILDAKRRKVSEGYNGFARGVKDTYERLNNRELKYPLTIHAELNAILFAKQDLDGCTIYVTPLPPCAGCASIIIQSGIRRVVARAMTPEIEERWGESVALSRVIFKEAGVELLELDLI